MTGKRILFIGSGNMAGALIEGLLKSSRVTSNDIAITEIRKERREEIEKKFGIRSYPNNREGVENSEVIVFAVKPQNIAEVFKELSNTSFEGKVVMSIAAGVVTNRFEKALGEGTRVVRVMPNMAAMLGCGISGISRGRYATAQDEALAGEIMKTVGEVVHLPENQLDAVTATSGSGPAYFFYFMEALQEAAIAVGLAPEVCTQLVQKTALGSALLVDKIKESPQVLRKKVTSPGGTTEAAIKIFEEAGIKDIIARAIKAAHQRSIELSQHK